MPTDVLVYRSGGDVVLQDLRGGDPYVLGSVVADFSRGTATNWFGQAGDGFVFRGGETSLSDDFLIYSDGTSWSYVLDEAGNRIQAESFIEFGNETLFMAPTPAVPGATDGAPALWLTNGSGVARPIMPERLVDDRTNVAIVGDSIYALASSGNIYHIPPGSSAELIYDRSTGGLRPEYIFEFDGALWLRGSTLEGNDFFRVDPVTQAIEAGNIGFNTGGDSIYFYLSSVGNDQFFYYIQNDNSLGTELYVSDGTGAGTRLVQDIWPGANDSYFRHMTATVGDRLFFVAEDGSSNNEELWVSDGTATGTFALSGFSTPVGDLDFSDTNIDQVVAVGNRVFFSAYRADVGAELFVTDGTQAGTRLVADLLTGPNDSYPETLLPFGDQLLFSLIYADGTADDAIWITDGTAAGTRVLSDPDIPAFNPTPQFFNVVQLDLPTSGQTIDGTTGQDTLEGTTGDDSIYGLGANDWLTGGDGEDLLDGGTGYDGVDYSLESGSLGVTVNLSGQFAIDTFGNTDSFISIELAAGTNQNDFLYGSFTFAVGLVGNSGDDQLWAYADVGDILWGGDGVDLIVALGGSSSIEGGNDTDYILTSYGDNTVNAGGGNDWVYLRYGTNVIELGEGYNLVLSNDLFETLPGQNFANSADTITGGSLDDYIYAGRGEDVIDGRAGNDWIAGGEWSDTLTGGAGYDRFIFADETGFDTITDFTNGDDYLDFTGSALVSSFADLTVVQSGADTFVAWNNGASGVTLEGVQAATITADDILA